MADAFDVKDIVGQVKAAITAANLSTEPSATDISVTEVDLTLKVVRDLEAGVDATWKVPFLNLDLSVKGGKKWSTTNTVEMKLVPPKPAQPKAEAVAPQIDVESELARAIQLVRTSVAAASTGTPLFDLKAASVELTFAVSDSGELSLVAKADADKDTTQTLSLTLGGPA